MPSTRGMPHKFYHGKTGRVWNVTKTSVGVEVNKTVSFFFFFFLFLFSFFFFLFLFFFSSFSFSFFFLTLFLDFFPLLPYFFANWFSSFPLLPPLLFSLSLSLSLSPPFLSPPTGRKQNDQEEAPMSRVEHVSKSASREAFLERVKENDKKRAEAKEKKGLTFFFFSFLFFSLVFVKGGGGLGGGGGNWVVLKEGGLREWNSVYGCVFGVWCVFVVGFVFEKTKPPFPTPKKNKPLSFLFWDAGVVVFVSNMERKGGGGGGGGGAFVYLFLFPFFQLKTTFSNSLPPPFSSFFLSPLQRSALLSVVFPPNPVPVSW